MISLVLVILYVFFVWLLVTRVRDGFTWLPLIGLGLGILIGRAALDEFGIEFNRLPVLLAAILFVAPFAVIGVVACLEGFKEWSRRRRLLSPGERARLDSEVRWESYDPSWLVPLIRAQLPYMPELAERVAACTKCTELDGEIYFVPPALLEAVTTSSWLIHIDETRSVLLDLLSRREPVKLQFLKPIPGENRLVRDKPPSLQ